MFKTKIAALAFPALLLSSTAYAAPLAADEDHISFDMVVSNGASTCLPNASAKVQIISDGQAEDMFVVATGLPRIPVSTSS